MLVLFLVVKTDDNTGDVIRTSSLQCLIRQCLGSILTVLNGLYNLDSILRFTTSLRAIHW